MYRTAYCILGRNDEAEDCVQDVFLELLSRSAPCDADRWSAVLRWMTTVRALDRLRRRRVWREVGPAPLDALPSPRCDVGEQAHAAEMHGWLRSAVAKLPPRRAQVFALRCFAEMSYDQIAGVLEIEQGAVGVILHEAREQLKAMLPAEWVENRKARHNRGTI
jgi:RNA polymerase sigma-70 factor, ECF subfamily